MGYTVLVAGVPVQCDTATEAIDLARQAGGESPSVGGGITRHTDKPPAPSGGSRWSEQRIKEFFRAIKTQQRKLVEALLETTDSRTDEQLCQSLGLADGRSLAGVFTGLWKNAKKVGADPKELYQRHSVTIGDKRQNEYTLVESFRASAKKWKS